MRWVWLVVGVVAVALGILWTLQGFNVVRGSGMSGHGVFAVIGVIVGIAGLVAIGVGALRPRARGA